MNILRWISAVCLLVAPALWGPTLAHHSTAGLFDRSKTIEFVAILEKVDIINPHSWFRFFEYTGESQGKEWSVEGGAPGQIRRAIIESYGSLEFEVGKKYKVKINPGIANEADGYLRELVFPDGSVLTCC
jgi:uncharacterized protein DUF6152